MINLPELRELGSTPRVHGNGFIQLDLNDRERLHIWGDPRIPKQKVATPIHDHVFGFHSRIIVGRLINMMYGYIPADFGDYRVYTIKCRKGEDTTLEYTSDVGRLYVRYSQMVNANSSSREYHILSGEIHESFVPDGPTATIINKDGPTQAQGGLPPRVFVPLHIHPDNDFDRFAFSEDLLWDIIADTLFHEVR